MLGTLQSVKSAALETYLSICSADARRIRALDEQHEPRSRVQDDQVHLQAALDWLCRAHDIGDDDGVSAMFSFAEGWVGSYPETTGYIIPTLYDLAGRMDRAEYSRRASEMAQWLLSLQTSEGAFPGSFMGQLSSPRIFNTGQVIFGLLRAVAETGQDCFLQAAIRAGEWLVRQQDDDGAWRRATLSNIVHTYNVRTAWALTELAAISGEHRFRDAGIKNAEWVTGSQDNSGWFHNNTFSDGDPEATLHTIAYAMRGLLEVGTSTGRQDFIDAADRTASSLHRGWRMYDEIGGAYGRDWSVSVPWRCLPGEAQLAVVWMRLDQLAERDDYKETAVTLLDRVKAAQIIDEQNPDLHGGLTGALPINGDYERYCLVSWGPKFLIDAILLKESNHGECPTG